MKKSPLAYAASAFALGVLALAPVAHADGLGGVSGWSPTPNVCGTQNQIPILVSNASNSTQTGSVTVPNGLAANVQLFSTQAALASAQGCGRSELMTAPGYSFNFTVAPGQTQVFWAALGGVDYNAIDDSHNIAIGGLPSGTSGQGWFNFNMGLTATESFSSLQVNYKGTGGTDGSNQNNFNVVACDTANGGVAPTLQNLTPYSASDRNGPAYGSGDPICLAWAPQGSMVPFIENGAPGMDINAAQLNYDGGDYLMDFAGTFAAAGQGGEIASLQAVISSGGEVLNTIDLPMVTSVPNSLTPFGFINGMNFGAINIPVSYGEEVTIRINGTNVGSATAVFAS